MVPKVLCLSAQDVMVQLNESEGCIGNHKATCGAQSHFSGDTKNLFTARDLTVGRFSINTKCAYSNLEIFGKIILALFTSIGIKRYLRF